VPEPPRLRAILAAVLVTVLAVVPAARAAAPTAIGDAAVDRMIDLNKKAFQDLREQRFQAAKYRLSEALVISETEGLENNEMTARTYVHFAVVELAGLKNREEAIKQFVLALKINPNITITPGLESPALKLAYLEAREQLGLPPNPDATAADIPRIAAVQTPKPAEGGGKLATHDNGNAAASEPDLPARVPAPIYCPLPFEILPGRDLVVRCLTLKQQKRSTATFFYRPEGGSDAFLVRAMARSPKGWLVVVVPGGEIQGRALSYYIQAQIPDGSLPLYIGHPEAPSTLLVAQKDAQEAGSTTKGSGPAPSREKTPAQPGRLPGTLWIALGFGSGAVYHRREPVDSGAFTPGTATLVHSESGFSPASLFQLEPQMGLQVSERLSLSAMARYQYAPAESGSTRPAEKDVPTSAFAAFARLHFALANGVAFQPYVSGGAGYGTSFLAVVGKRCGADACYLAHSDTLHGGSVGLNVGAGILYHVTDSFGVFAEFNEIATVPKFMALSELNLGLSVAYKFGQRTARSKADSTSRVSWR
jgi:hypothetical protein